MIRIFFIGVILLHVSLMASVATVVVVNGSVEILRSGESLPAVINMALENHDHILTHQHARIKVRFDDNTMLSLGQNSNFGISDYRNSADEKRSELEISKGFFKIITGTIGKIAPQKFKIKTNSATIGIRGTTILGEIADEYQYITCSSGAIFIRYQNIIYEIQTNQQFHSDITGKLRIIDVDPKHIESLQEQSGWVPIINDNERELYQIEPKELELPKEKEKVETILDDMTQRLEIESEKLHKSNEAISVPKPPERPY